MRLTPAISLIGSGQLGLNMTDPLDCKVYAVDGGDEIAIIDAGLGRQTDRLLANLAADGLDPQRVTTIVLTHAHGDHAGGLARLREVTGARVVVPAEAAPWVEHGDEAKISLDLARAAGMYPADYRWQPCPVDWAVADGDAIAVGRLALRAIDTPGHARGHCAYLLEAPDGRALFAGDLVFWGGRVSLQNIWDCSIQDLAASLEKLAGLNVTALLPGHGLLPLADGQAHIDRALDIMRRLGVPPPLA
jgi:glyoxylase-like metal-dependent hydrolase (beta-lactamase superfamily II)